MPTKFRRIAVTEDPDLAAALASAAEYLPGRSSAALLKELAIRGVESVKAESGTNPGLQRILAMPGVRPATGSIQDFLRERGPLGEIDPDDPNRGSRMLQELREDKI